MEGLGHDTTVVSSALDAIEVLKQHPLSVDLLCTDSRMPGMPGSELLAWVREHLPTLPYVVCTGDMDDGLVGDQARFGFDVLTKPFSVQELATAVGKHLKIDSA